MNLNSQIKSEMRIIERAVLMGIDGETDPYAESEWDNIKQQIVALAKGTEMETFCRKAMNRAEKRAYRRGEDPQCARQTARFEAEQEWSKSHAD